jgi:hypothetical protein
MVTIGAVRVCRERCWRKDWVVDIDVKAFFDSVPWDLMLKALARHKDQEWLLTYVPLAGVALLMARRHLPESGGPTSRERGRFDAAGATLVTLGLAGVIYALIEGPGRGWRPVSVGAAGRGIVALVAFPLVERTGSGAEGERPLDFDVVRGDVFWFRVWRNVLGPGRWPGRR